MAKYIKTSKNEIIVFSDLLQHKDMKHFNPVTAGFISFGIDEDGNPSCMCWGDSSTLELKSDEALDSIIAKRQILGFDY